MRATYPVGTYQNIQQKVAVITGAASGIGEAVSRELAIRGAKAVLLVDRSDAVQDLAKSINKAMGRTVAEAKVGDTTDEAFRKRVFNDAAGELWCRDDLCAGRRHHARLALRSG